MQGSNIMEEDCAVAFALVTHSLIHFTGGLGSEGGTSPVHILPLGNTQFADRCLERTQEDWKRERESSPRERMKSTEETGKGEKEGDSLISEQQRGWRGKEVGPNRTRKEAGYQRWRWGSLKKALLGNVSYGRDQKRVTGFSRKKSPMMLVSAVLVTEACYYGK